MKKKTLALVLAFTMTAALFTGCGSKNETETTQPQTETAAETEKRSMIRPQQTKLQHSSMPSMCRPEMRTQMSSVQQQKQHGTN